MNIYYKTLKASDLTYTANGGFIFKNINFSIPPGKALILHGPNGSGKSTLLKLIADFISHHNYTGEISFDEEFNVTQTAALQSKPSIAYIGTDSLLNPELTATENLNYWAFLNSAPKPTRPVFDLFNIFEFKDIPVKFLSTGQQKRVALSYLLVNIKPIWLLDEPALGLDGKSLKILESVLRSHLVEGGQVIIASHTNINIGAAFLNLI